MGVWLTLTLTIPKRTDISLWLGYNICICDGTYILSIILSNVYTHTHAHTETHHIFIYIIFQQCSTFNFKLLHFERNFCQTDLKAFSIFHVFYILQIYTHTAHTQGHCAQPFHNLVLSFHIKFHSAPSLSLSDFFVCVPFSLSRSVSICRSCASLLYIFIYHVCGCVCVCMSISAYVYLLRKPILFLDIFTILYICLVASACWSCHLSAWLCSYVPWAGQIGNALPCHVDTLCQVPWQWHFHLHFGSAVHTYIVPVAKGIGRVCVCVLWAHREPSNWYL